MLIDEQALTRAVQRKASFLVATNVLDADQLSDRELIQTYKDQHSVERGSRFLKDPLFLASSVFVKKPERIVALSLVMVLCLLGLSARRASPARPVRGHRPDRPQSAEETDRSADDALDLPVFRRRGSAPHPPWPWPGSSPGAPVCSPYTGRCSRSLARRMKKSIKPPLERANGGGILDMDLATVRHGGRHRQRRRARR